LKYLNLIYSVFADKKNPDEKCRVGKRSNRRKDIRRRGTYLGSLRKKN